jgi:hypothetical protein
MARPLKDNADWFAHDAEMRNNRKIRALRTSFGLDGYAVWCMLLECLTEADKFILAWAPLDRKLIAGDFGITAEKLDQITAFCCEIGLLKITDDRIFCENHQIRMKPLTEERERKRAWKEAKKRVSDGENTVIDGENQQSRDRGRDTGRGTVKNTINSISSSGGQTEPPNTTTTTTTQNFIFEKKEDSGIPTTSAADFYQTVVDRIETDDDFFKALLGWKKLAGYSDKRHGPTTEQFRQFIAYNQKNRAFRDGPMAFLEQYFPRWLSIAAQAKPNQSAKYEPSPIQQKQQPRTGPIALSNALSVPVPPHS